MANEAKLYDALVTNVPQVKRSVVQDSVTKTLSDFAGVGVRLAFNLEGKVFGRSYVSTLDEIAKIFQDDEEAIAARLTVLTTVLDAAVSARRARCGKVRCFHSATDTHSFAHQVMAANF